MIESDISFVMSSPKPRSIIRDVKKAHTIYNVHELYNCTHIHCSTKTARVLINFLPLPQSVKKVLKACHGLSGPQCVHKQHKHHPPDGQIQEQGFVITLPCDGYRPVVFRIIKIDTGVWSELYGEGYTHVHTKLNGLLSLSNSYI